MKEFYIKAKPLAASASQAFGEATAEELRVLIALIELEGRAITEEAVAARAGTSLARARASINLWVSEGVASRSDNEINIVDEFEPDAPLASAKKTAEIIREDGLRSLHEEIAAVLGKPMLDRDEISQITSLYTDLALSPEYIVTLAHHVKERREASGKEAKLRVGYIVNRARSMVENGVDTLEMLERHIELAAQDTKDERVIRQILGIWGRAISKSQKEYFRKWMNEFCFGEEIISEAYDIAAIKTQNASLSYMDKILTSWHEAGCKTLDECRSFDTAHLKAQKEKRSSRPQKTEAQTPKYGNFDPTAALEAAIKRSFSKDK